MPFTQKQIDAFHQFLDSKGVTRECRACGHNDSVALMPSVAGIEDADHPQFIIRLMSMRCFNCGAMQFFDPRAAGIDV
jgi:hypothetical protein